MNLIDLVLQGVRKFVQSQKIPFKPGLNIILGGNESGKSTLYDCIVEMMFPNRIAEEQFSWTSWKAGEQARAGLTFAKDDQLYRILKDFTAQKISLSRKAPGSEKFERLSGEPSEIASILAEEFGLIGWDDYKNLFLESLSGLPSLAGIGKMETMSAPAEDTPEESPAPVAPQRQQHFGGQEYLGMGMPGMGIPGMGMPGMGMPGLEMMEQDGTNWEEKEKRLEKLKSELSRIKEMEELQFEIDGLQSKMFELSKQKEKVKKIDIEITKLDNELEKYRFFRNLPENLEQRIEQYDSLQDNKGKDLDALDQKLADADEMIRYLEMQPKFFTTNIFKTGAGVVGAGILGMIVGSMNIAEIFKTLQGLFGLTIVAGIVVMAIPLWKFLGNKNKAEELKKSLARMEDQRKTTAKDYEVKGAIVKRLLEQTKCDHTEELKELLHNFQALDTKRNELGRKKKELIIELDYEKLNKEEAELKDKISNLEHKLKGYASLGSDPNETRREIDQLEAGLDRARKMGIYGRKPAEAQAQAAAGPKWTQDAGKTQTVTSAQRSLMPFWDRLLDSGAHLLGTKSDELLGQVLGRAKLYLQAFSSKHYQDFRKDGNSILVRMGNWDKEVDLTELGRSGADIIYLSFKFALLEMLVAKYQFPVLLDDPYLFLDEARANAIAKTLKRLSQKTQIIVFTSQKLFVREADHALTIG